MYNGEDAFASDPVAVLVLDSGIVHGSSLVEADPTALDGLSEGDLIWMKVLPA